jgi:hypothetical protein
LNSTLLRPALAQRAFAVSSICSVASKATTEAAFGASAAVTTPGPQATSIKRPLAALPSAEPKRVPTSASTFSAQTANVCACRVNSSVTRSRCSMPLLTPFRRRAHVLIVPMRRLPAAVLQVGRRAP